MITVSIIGSGNVAYHLICAFKKLDTIRLVQICARNITNIEKLVDSKQIVSSPQHLKPVDVCLIAISDDAVAEMSELIPFQNKIVAHTSGTLPITALSKKNRRAVFYPLQTFSRVRSVDFSTIPICLETEFHEDYEVLQTLAHVLSEKTYPINSEQRRALHVAAVFVNNFVNQMYQVGFEICAENNISFEILKPLINETAEKIKLMTPLEAQTGPAKRNDEKTIKSHLDFLQNKERQALYKLLTQTIQSYE
jgi:predicted short-subunit dehydrogenase-like oxidoreductase (DUF2520 family)